MPRASQPPAPLDRTAVDLLAGHVLTTLDTLCSHAQDVRAAYEQVIASHSVDGLLERKAEECEEKLASREREHEHQVEKLRADSAARVAVLEQEIRALKEKHQAELKFLHSQLDLLASEHDFLKEETQKHREYQHELLLKVVSRNPAPGESPEDAS